MTIIYLILILFSAASMIVLPEIVSGISAWLIFIITVAVFIVLITVEYAVRQNRIDGDCPIDLDLENDDFRQFEIYSEEIRKRERKRIEKACRDHSRSKKQ